MSEHRMLVREHTGERNLRHGPDPATFVPAATHVLLCGECGIHLIRSGENDAPRHFVIVCDNCGAINTDISQF